MRHILHTRNNMTILQSDALILSYPALYYDCVDIYLLNSKVPRDCFNIFFRASKDGNMVVLHSRWFFKSGGNLKV